MSATNTLSALNADLQPGMHAKPTGMANRIASAAEAIEAAEQTRVRLQMDSEWEWLRRQIYKRALFFADTLHFDFRLLLTDARCAELAGRLLWQLIRPFSPEVLVGPGFGAMPLLYATALAAFRDNVRLQVLMIRDKRKGHNQKKWVEGWRQPDNSRAIVLDDFMAGGSAVPLVEEALAADGHVLDIQAVAVFFDMWKPLGSRQISTSRYPVIPLYKRHDIGLSRDCFDAVPPLMKGAYPDFVGKPSWWRFGLHEKAIDALKSSPVVAENAVFVADDNCRVWRHNAENGDIEWRYDSLSTHRKGIVQQLQYVAEQGASSGSLVFGCYDGTVTRLSARTGDVIWRWRQDTNVHATPEIDHTHSRLFINTEHDSKNSPFGHLYALDWKTGKTLWSYQHGWWPPGSPAYDGTTQTVIATCNDQSVVAVDANSGVLRWKKTIRGMVRGKPVTAKGRVFLASEHGKLVSLDIANGETLWERNYGRGEMHLFLKVVGDAIFVLDGRWHFTAFDINTGEIRWLSRLRSTGNWCPVVFGKYLIVLSRDGGLAIFDPQREIKVWEGYIGGQYRQPPAVGRTAIGNVLAAASNTDGLKVFRIHDFYGADEALL